MNDRELLDLIEAIVTNVYIDFGWGLDELPDKNIALAGMEDIKDAMVKAGLFYTPGHLA